MRKIFQRLLTRVAFLTLIAALVMGGFTTASAAPLPGGTVDPLTIPKYVQPLVIPPVMPASNAGTPLANYNTAVRQFQQQILPGGAWNLVAPDCVATPGLCSFPATTVWSYGKAEEVIPANFVAPVPLSNTFGVLAGEGLSFNYPAFTIEATSGAPTSVRWINDLVDASGNYLPHLLAVDQTLHWANPAQELCINAGGGNHTDCETHVPTPYTGPVPIVTHVHGAHVDPHSDGYPEAWWLPAANNIPAGYANTGSVYTQADYANTTPGSAFYNYRNDQPATTIWYHDHTIGMTRLNVYAGPAGFWLIRGGANDTAAGVLPGPAPGVYNPNDTPATIADPNFNAAYRNTIREIPIAIQDRAFDWADAAGNVLPDATGATQAKLFYPSDRVFFDGFNGPYIGNAQDGLMDYVMGVGPTDPASGRPLGNSDISGIWNPEAFFNTMVVNGTTWPVFNVDDARYRLRLLNGCNSRALNLSLFVVTDLGLDGIAGTTDDVLGAEVPFYQIGADQGFLPKVVKITTGFSTVLPGGGVIPADTSASDPDKALLLMNAERADVIVDFTGLAAGTRIRMLNTAPDAPFGGFPDVPADPGTSGQVMDFVVDTAIGATDPSTPVASLVLPAAANLGAEDAVRPLSLNELISEQVCVNIDVITGEIITLFSRPSGDTAFATDCLNTPPINVGDTVEEAGPRQARMGTLIPNGTGGWTPVPKAWGDPVTEFPVFNSVEVWEFYNVTADAHPVHIHLVGFNILNRQDIDPVTLAPIGLVRDPEPNELGYKDTVISYPGQVVRVKAHFDIEGLYVWHCHIVEHEDNEMMRPFTVVTQQAVAPFTLAVPSFTDFDGSVTVYAGISTTPGVHYIFEYKKTADATWIVLNAGTVTNPTITGLTPGNWEFRVKAVDANTPPTFADSVYTLGNQTTAVSVAATMTAPADLSTLTGTSQLFTWNTGADLNQLYVGTTLGASNLGRWPSVAAATTSVTVPGLPNNGTTVFVRLWSKYGTYWGYVDYSYTAWAPPAAATMIAPADLSTLAGTSQLFTWNTGADLNQLYVGTTLGASNLGRWPSDAAATTSVTVPGLPSNGTTVFVRLYSKYGSSWVYNDYSYTAWAPPAAATMIAPADLATLAGTSQLFTWNTGADLNQLYVGTTLGASNLGRWPSVAAATTSVTVPGLPNNGTTVFVRLYSKYGSAWVYNDYSYTASAPPVASTMITPVYGSLLSGGTVPFTWTSGNDLYQLYVGTTPGSSNLGRWPATATTATSVAVNGLPANGSSVFVRLYSQKGGTWVFTDYAYVSGP